MSQTPAGWYPEPSGDLRWWDGERWTEHRAPAPSTPAVGAAARQARRSHLPWIWAGIAFVAVAAVAVVLVVLLRGDSDGPRRTIDAFMAATNENDCAGAAEYLSSGMSDDFDTEDCQPTDDEGNPVHVRFAVDKVTVDGDAASVRGELRDTTGTYQPDEWDDLVFSLVREDGHWLIEDLQPAGGTNVE